MITIRDIFGAKKSLKKDEAIGFSFGRPEIPQIIEKKNKDYILFGEDNNYPELLTELLNTSAIHNAIVTTKAKMMAGASLLINGAKTQDESDAIFKTLSKEQQAAWNNFVENKLGNENLYKILERCARNFQKNGSFAIEIIHDINFTKVVALKFVNTDNIRSGKLVDDKVEEYYYSRDWSQATKAGYKPQRIAAYDITNKIDVNQLIYVKQGDLEYYGEPSYKGALSWIKIDSQMGLFHLSNIENGFAPSMIFKFYKKPDSPEEQQYILENLKRQYSGAKNTGKGITLFSDGKELAPDVEPIQVSNLDKQYILLADQAAQQILTGHSVTSPELFGLSVPGKLGTSDIDKSFKIFDKTVMESDRNLFEDVLNDILKRNKTGITLEIEPFNPMI